MEAIVLRPALKEIVWGGQKLKTQFGYESSLANIAEAWVVSAHKEGVSRAAGGRFNGRGLDAILQAHPEFAGQGAAGDFPLMIKFIDAARDLSVQVHPDDAYAAAHEGGYGKTEMWYVLSADPGAFIYYGMKERVSSGRFIRSVREGTVCGLLNKVTCRAGDIFFIPAGTVHAIGAGLLICEVQQSANLTYRIFDYNRPGSDGKPRELQIEKASQVIDYRPAAPNAAPRGTPRMENGLEKTLLVKCDRFETTLCRCEKSASDSNAGFALLAVLDGEAQITTACNTVSIRKGDGVFLPAGLGEYRIEGRTEYVKAVL